MQGIMDGVFNEAYIPASAAEKIFDVKLDTDFENLALKAIINRDIPVLAILQDNSGTKIYSDFIFEC